MISEFDVEMAYKYILGRQPENREVVTEQAMSHSSVDQLRRTMFNSPEFREKLPLLTE